MISAILFSKNLKQDDIIAVGGYCNVRLWNIQSKCEMARLNFCAGYASCLAFSHDSRILAVGSTTTHLTLFRGFSMIG